MMQLINSRLSEAGIACLVSTEFSPLIPTTHISHYCIQYPPLLTEPLKVGMDPSWELMPYTINFTGLQSVSCMRDSVLLSHHFNRMFYYTSQGYSLSAV
ncbi:hypothetical protein Ahia01_001005400 [Argonauta hians]